MAAPAIPGRVLQRVATGIEKRLASKSLSIYPKCAHSRVGVRRLKPSGDSVSRTMVKTVKTLENGVWTVCLALTVEKLKTLKDKTLKDKKPRH